MVKKLNAAGVQLFFVQFLWQFQEKEQHPVFLWGKQSQDRRRMMEIEGKMNKVFNSKHLPELRTKIIEYISDTSQNPARIST